MTSITKRVWRFITPDSAVYECRNCGNTLDPDAIVCPLCESDEISYYELE